MLTRLHVRGYKALRDIDVAFEPLTVIVGPNGCGKTSVLEAIDLVLEASSSRGHTMARLDEDMRSKGEGTEALLVDLTTLELRGSTTLPGNLSMQWEHSEEPGTKGVLKTGGERASTGGLVQRLGFDAAVLARSTRLSEAEPSLGNDGNGLGTVLNWLQGERDDRFAVIEQALHRFVPEVRRIRTRRVPVLTTEPAEIEIGKDDQGRPVYEKRSYLREEIGHQVVIDFEHADGVPGPFASEGTLLLLGLLTAIHTSGSSVLLLDDIERGLHPKSQQQLVGYLREMTEQGIQIIATSHSPYLLLHLDYDQVRAMTLDGAHGSRIGKLSEHPQFERWKDEMSPSEFWTVFGEDWLRERGKGE